MQIDGQGGAPRVHVTGPGGQVLDSTDNGIDYSPGGKIRILRYEGKDESFAVVGLQDAKPGTYTVTPQAGSVPFTTIMRATDQAAAKVTGRVTGTGSRRTLTYNVRKRPNQQVIFSDVTASGAKKEIGRVKNPGRGEVRFSPAPGKARRHIEAQFVLDDIPAERKTVTSFGPPAPGLAKPRGVRVKRAKTNVTISWRRVSSATRYEVAITSRTGFQRFVTTRKRSLVLKKVPKSATGTVTVRAIDTFRQSQPTATRLKPLAGRTSSFRKAKRCTVGKKKVTCR
jgi:hypothetical protein